MTAHLDDTDLDFLRAGELTVVGRIMEASNATLLCEIRTDDRAAYCVYKPVRGERPLWDFPDGTLAGRELSAYLVCRAAGWRFVPPTVLRDGPLGTGMVQLWVDGDADVDLAEYIRAEPPTLRLLSVLDAVINNSDRKGGHLIPHPGDGALADRDTWAVDHGVCFSVEDKLRTLLWMWAGEPLPPEAVEALGRLQTALAGDLGRELDEHLTRREVARTQQRVADLLRTGRHPEPSGDWPAIPYPPF